MLAASLYTSMHFPPFFSVFNYANILTANLFCMMLCESHTLFISLSFFLFFLFFIFSCFSPFLSNHRINFATRLSRLTFESKKLPFFSDFETQTLTFSSSNVPAGSSRRLDRLLAVFLLGAMTEPNLERETLEMCVLLRTSSSSFFFWGGGGACFIPFFVCATYSNIVIVLIIN